MAAINGTSHLQDDDIDYSDIEAKYNVEMEEGFDNIVVLDGAPVVDKSKYEKLVAKLCKDFSKRGCNIKPENVDMPWDTAKGKTKGFAFLEFASPDDAALAISAMNGHKFDAKHTFLLNRFTDVEKFQDYEEDFVEPEPGEFKPREHVRAWLADPQGRDQYVTFRDPEVAIHWHGKPSQSEINIKRSHWADAHVRWSPLGSMLATVHQQGVQLWGGLSWMALRRFPHHRVTLIDFSPNERYLVTMSSEPISLSRGPQSSFTEEDEGNQIAVWDMKAGELLRTFPVQAPVEDGKRARITWPILKWSPDDRYVARVTPGQQISVYELPGMGLLDKKSIKIDGVVDLEWCPFSDQDRDDAEKAAKGTGASKGKKTIKENMLAYWTPEVQDQPARVSVMAIPSRTVLRAKNLFNVTECKLYWQDQGDFLCVKVDRHTKTKKSIFCNLEIFRVREKDFPVEVVELKDTVTDFSWEPRGERFAIVSSSDPNLGNPGPGITIKYDVSFYQLERGKGDFKLLKALNNRSTDVVRWSPRGRHVCLATLHSSSRAELEFWDLDFYSDDVGRREPGKEEWGAGIVQLGTAEHYGMTDLDWDPSGRYLATTASKWRGKEELGYAIWDFRGQQVEKHLLDNFYQLLWRPRPRTLLSKEKQRQIRKNLKEYSRVFEEEDAAEESNVSAELIAQRRRLVDEWNAWRARCQREDGLEGQAKGESEGKEEIEVEIEEIIEVTEEVLDE